MSELIILGYEDHATAEKAYQAVLGLQGDFVVDLTGLAVVRIDPDGKKHVDTPARIVGASAAAGARVLSFRWNGRYPKKKQWCLQTLPLAHPWVLYLDADERMTPEATAEISALMAAGLALFVVTLVVNFTASSIVARSRSGAESDG